MSNDKQLKFKMQNTELENHLESECGEIYWKVWRDVLEIYR